MGKRKLEEPEEVSKKHKPEPEPNLKFTLQLKKHFPWPESDILELVSKIEENIPTDDHLSYSSRLEKLNWENITFKTYSAKDCKDTWSVLYKHVRKYRLLGELLGDIKSAVLVQEKVNIAHPDKPKQPLNSYMLFAEEKREEVSRENPNLKANERAQVIGKLFKALPDSEKEKYEKKAKKYRKEYQVKLQDFYNEHPDLAPKSKKKPIDGPEKPKKPFDLFCQEEMKKLQEEFPNESKSSHLQICKDRWAELTDKEKYFWINWAEEGFQKYLADLKEYLKEHPSFEFEPLKTILTKNEVKIKDRCSGKPDRPPRGAYQLFTKSVLDSDGVRGLTNKDVMNYISESWRVLPEDEKKEYKTRVEQMWETYHEKLELYLQNFSPEDRDRVREQESRNTKKIPKKEDSHSKIKKEVKVAKPVTPPVSVHKYFLSVYQGEEKPETVWKNLDEQERKMYENQLKEVKKEYILEYEKYLRSLTPEELGKLDTSKLMNDSETDSSDSEFED